MKSTERALKHARWHHNCLYHFFVGKNSPVFRSVAKFSMVLNFYALRPKLSCVNVAVVWPQGEEEVRQFLTSPLKRVVLGDVFHEGVAPQFCEFCHVYVVLISNVFVCAPATRESSVAALEAALKDRVGS